MLLCSAQENQQNWYLWNLYHQNKGKRKIDAVSYAQVNEAVKVIRCVCMCMFIKISETMLYVLVQKMGTIFKLI